MTTLYAIAFNHDKLVRTIQTLRHVRRQFFDDDGGIQSAREAVQELARRPIVVGTSEDEGKVKGAEDDLAVIGVETVRELTPEQTIAFESHDPDPTPLVPAPAKDSEVAQFPQPPRPEQPPTPDYEACKVALILLAHTNGNPTMAISAADGQEHVLEGDAAETMGKVKQVLLDVFQRHPEAT